MHLRSLAALLLIVCCLIPTLGQAQSVTTEWWFDVEIILFKRNQDLSALNERFNRQTAPSAAATGVDLFGSWLNTDLSGVRGGLPSCETQPDPYPLPDDMLSVFDPAVLQPSKQLMAEQANAEQTSSSFIPDENLNDTPINEDELAAYRDPNWQLHEASESLKALLAWQAPSQLGCEFASERQVNFADPEPTPFAEMPATPGGLPYVYTTFPHLLPQESLQLGDLYADIRRQRQLQPLLHAGWRQEVKFGRNKASSFRLIAGKNWATDFDQSGQRLLTSSDEIQSKTGIQLNQRSPLAASENLEQAQDSMEQLLLAQQQANQQLFDKIEVALADNSPYDYPLPRAAEQDNAQQFVEAISDLWELEGQFTLYLEYIGRVPYLHIDSNLDFRAPLRIALQQNSLDAPAGDYQLKQFPFQQLRRVVSKQLHYFDHPLFGMLVHIRRHHRPNLTALNPDMLQ